MKLTLVPLLGRPGVLALANALRSRDRDGIGIRLSRQYPLHDKRQSLTSATQRLPSQRLLFFDFFPGNPPQQRIPPLRICPLHQT